MRKKIVIIIIIIFLAGGTVWLFNNNRSELASLLKKEIFISNSSTTKKASSYKKPSNETKQKNQLLETKTENNDLNATPKTDLENYFFILSNMNFPELNLILDAITLHIKGESEGLKIIIAIFKDKENKMSEIKPPQEANSIHKKNLLAINKMVNILEEILGKANDGNKLKELVNNLNIEETQQIITQTEQEITFLIAKYNLKISS